MEPVFNNSIGAYYNNRTIEIAHAAHHLGTDRMVNAYGELSYGQSISGHFLIKVSMRGKHPVLIMFTDDHMELYNANANGFVKSNTGRAYYEYSSFSAMEIEHVHKFIWDHIKFMTTIENDYDMHDVKHPADPVYNSVWRGYFNHNIEQVRECVKYLTPQNMGYGQAFYGYNSMCRLIVWVKHHPSIDTVKLPEEHRHNSIIAEFEGDGIVIINKADEFGMLNDDKYRGVIDDHGCKMPHEAFVNKAKKDCGVHLL